MTGISWNHAVAELPDLRMHYVRHGSGMPLILLHGWPEFWYTWRHNIPALAESFDVIAPDLRGFGDTDKPDSVPEVDSYVADLAAFADALGLARFGVVAHDIGANIIQPFARRWPERLSGLFLFNVPYPGIGRRWADADHLIETWYQYFHQIDLAADIVGTSRDSCRRYFRHFLSHWARDPHAFDDDLEAWVDNFMKPGNLRGGFAWYRATDAGRRAMIRDGAPAMAPVTVPTRVLWGAHDPILKAEWRDRLGEYFTDIRVDLAPDAGHFVHYESPDLANREIAAFFAGRGG